MSNKVASKKWISEETNEEEELFNHCREMQMVCYAITKVILDADNKWRGSPGKTSVYSLSNRSYIMELVNIQVLDQIIEYLAKLVKSFYKLNPRLARLKKVNELVQSKHDHVFASLCRARFVMLQAMLALVTTILNTCLHRDDSRKMIESCLSLIAIYNHLLGLSYKAFAAKFSICSNAYPTTISETRTVTLTKIVQILAKSRAEVNCHRLINCLVKVYKPGTSSDDTSSSAGDSLEIYHTLTKHITPPTSTMSRELTVEKRREAFIEHKKAKMKQAQSMVEAKNEQNRRLSQAMIGQNSDCDVEYTSLLTNECVLDVVNTEENVNAILQSEEKYIEILLDTVANMAPSLLGANGVRKLKSGRIQASKKAAHKVTEYYQNILWGDVGSCLEHIVLWWSAFPLATRSPNTSQNLREWLFSTFSVNNTPELVLSALRILADALGCHVTSTSWDKLFGATLTTNLKVTSLKTHPDLSLYVTECTASGASFALMLQQLVTLNNQCEVTWEYILGAPIEDLPIVEQIPILHRLDHSIHTYRLWCLAETRRLANLWDMDDFFRVAHNDMQLCMEQLVNLRFADHSIAIESGQIGVHENVCAKMREKLVSEVKVNIQKLKEATEEIVGVVSSVCATTSLAHLTMVFPSGAVWRRVGAPPQPSHSLYVREFLDKMLLPVVKATADVTTLNMVLRIMCESWLHHIYVAKVKFSKDAAVQLLADFNEVRVWLDDCKQLPAAARKQMLQNEVLRRCEGVGRLLLHAPGDLLAMQDSTSQLARRQEEESAEQLMPAEMYVPNQKQWLTLRANTFRGPLAFTLCCIVLC
ncbi:uncharacterized protein LOC128674352 isoform X1 [Plodia interpunctella]|uniref:uncharacterized protein LOC128674352 isoform X1 n=1 Tax=Plodia interpunctella TaxID=58824 RepID=UPI0023674A7B|nr:uncharacterized protein LOC128674352 isoform X1 [Plodia interpunctella]